MRESLAFFAGLLAIGAAFLHGVSTDERAGLPKQPLYWVSLVALFIFVGVSVWAA